MFGFCVQRESITDIVFPPLESLKIPKSSPEAYFVYAEYKPTGVVNCLKDVGCFESLEEAELYAEELRNKYLPSRQPKKVLKFALDIPGTEIKKGMEYELMGEDAEYYTLWGETEDGGDTFRFPKVIQVQVGVITDPIDVIRARRELERLQVEESIAKINDWAKSTQEE